MYNSMRKPSTAELTRCLVIMLSFDCMQLLVVLGVKLAGSLASQLPSYNIHFMEISKVNYLLAS